MVRADLAAGLLILAWRAGWSAGLVSGSPGVLGWWVVSGWLAGQTSRGCRMPARRVNAAASWSAQGQPVAILIGACVGRGRSGRRCAAAGSAAASVSALARAPSRRMVWVQAIRSAAVNASCSQTGVDGELPGREAAQPGLFDRFDPVLDPGVGAVPGLQERAAARSGCRWPGIGSASRRGLRTR